MLASNEFIIESLTLPPVPKQPFVKMEDGAISVVLAGVMFTVMVVHHVYSILNKASEHN